MPGKEISTDAIVRDALRKGKSVFVPYMHEAQKSENKGSLMDMLRLMDETDLDSLEPDAWGIPTLSEESINRRQNALGGQGIESDMSSPQLKLIFIPAVAFDQAHRRLGNGKGFYDRYLQRYSSALSRKNGSLSMPPLGSSEFFPM